MKTYENYVITKPLDLDLKKLKVSCNILYNLILREFDKDKLSYSGTSTVSTKLFNSYNVLLYPLPQIWELHQEIRTMFREVSKSDEPFFTQCWLNFYKTGDFIDWHRHGAPELNSWHGFFCVDVEPSKTTYRIPNVVNDVDIIGKDNLLVLSKSDGDKHRTWGWDFERPRITIAFDIVPASFINPINSLNHWVPV